LMSNDERRLSQKYQLHEVLGVGSTSVCHRCIERATGKQFACKIIDKYEMEQRFSGMLDQFHTEIEALRSLNHPNIISLNDVYTTKDKIYIIMELMAGGELFDYVVKKGTLTEAEASTIVRMVTSALVYMHGQNIVHRDLKPENLMLTRKPNSIYDIEVKIIDFGLSKVMEEGMAKSFLGTRGYLAPEMLQRRDYSKKIDTWALGVIVFILVCGCLPFDDDPSKIEADANVQSKFKLRLPKWARDLSPSAKDLLSHLLDINTNTRYTADQAMRHPWIEGSAAPKNSLLKSPGRMMLTPGKKNSPYTAKNKTQMNQIMAGRARANSNSRPHRQMVRKTSI
jgi:serine/threonine protein kinase